MEKNMGIKQEIIESINIIVNSRIQSLVNNDVATIVEEADPTHNKYKVRINGIEKWVKDGVGISPSVGQSVWVHMPNGSLKDSYISARR